MDYANFFPSINADVSSGSTVSLLVFSFHSIRGFSFSSHVCISQISIFGRDDSPGHSFLTGCPTATLNSALLFLSRTLPPTPQALPSEPVLPPLSPDDRSRPCHTPSITLDPGAPFYTPHFPSHRMCNQPLSPADLTPLVHAMTTASLESCHSHFLPPRTLLFL